MAGGDIGSDTVEDTGVGTGSGTVGEREETGEVVQQTEEEETRDKMEEVGTGDLKGELTQELSLLDDLKMMTAMRSVLVTEVEDFVEVEEVKEQF